MAQASERVKTKAPRPIKEMPRVTQCHFCCLLLVKASHMAKPILKGKETKFYLFFSFNSIGEIFFFYFLKIALQRYVTYDTIHPFKVYTSVALVYSQSCVTITTI